MTLLARKILTKLDSGLDAEQILALGIGDSINEVEFVIAQIRFVRGE